LRLVSMNYLVNSWLSISFNCTFNILYFQCLIVTHDKYRKSGYVLQRTFDIKATIKTYIIAWLFEQLLFTKSYINWKVYWKWRKPSCHKKGCQKILKLSLHKFAFDWACRFQRYCNSYLLVWTLNLYFILLISLITELSIEINLLQLHPVNKCKLTTPLE
jgi:hypothetical protein